MSGERTLSSLSNYRKRYRKLDREGRSELLDEFCENTDYHRKYAISLLRKPEDLPDPGSVPRRRGATYGAVVARALTAVWKASGYPWSTRLKALLPQWLPWARKHVRGLTPEVEVLLLKISARQMDRLLAVEKRQVRKRLYGHTKPGTLLKSQIPIRTDNWDISVAGYLEIDLVSHCGPSASGEFVYSLNATDIHTQWTETRAILGKGEAGVVEALEEICGALPFPIMAIDSDNGSEFINYHLARWCTERELGFTRSRPYKKNDNAHVEQKNWTHVRKIHGWARYDTAEARDAMNDLYRGDLSYMQNYFQPSVKLLSKTRIGTQVKRTYDDAQTPLERLRQAKPESPKVLSALETCAATDPFALAKRIEKKVARIVKMSRDTGGNS
jgi:hypothetical protein